MTDNFYFELPVNELVRACIRLEFLFNKVDNYRASETSWCSRALLEAIIDIAQVLDRPDLKSKLTSAFIQQAGKLEKYKQSSHVDHSRLDNLIAEINNILSMLEKNPGKLGSELRDNEFLDNIRQHLLYPGGECGFETPAYHYWLQTPIAQQQEKVTDWLKQLDLIRKTVDLYLMLIRSQAQSSKIVASKGFHQVPLNTQGNVDLIRIKVPDAQQTFPVISAGKHRININFYDASQIEKIKHFQ